MTDGTGTPERPAADVAAALQLIEANEKAIGDLRTQSEITLGAIAPRLVGSRLMARHPRALYEINHLEVGWDGAIVVHGRRVLSGGRGLGRQSWDLGALSGGRLLAAVKP